MLTSMLSLALLCCASCDTNTYLGRWMTWRASDIRDFEKFPKIEFEPAQAPFYFIKAVDLSLEFMMVPVGKGKSEPLRQVLEDSESTAFIVVRNDSLLYEEYFNGYTRDSINTSFSVGKSVSSLMIGRAVDEGLINSIEDPVTMYIPELREQDINYDKVTIAHLLDMRSGIQFKDHDLPWGDKPKAYYYPRLRERMKELPIVFEPGTKFQYNSYNPIFLGMVLEKVTHQSAADFFESRIWNKLGMEYSGSWSLDSDESRMTKMESGLNIRAIDFAKLGRLVLKNGNWNGEQVLSEEWLDNLRSVSPAYKVAEFGEEVHYKHLWWLFSSDQSSAYIISGWGHLGQYLYVYPKEGFVIVRMGKDTGKVASWKNLFQEIVDQKKSK